jgi:4-hydroxy-tetrahydrodipicolinate synthase
MFKGSFVALVTPFTVDGKLDEAAFQALIEWHIAAGTDGIVPMGTTGESVTLSFAEYCRVIEMAVEIAKGRITIMAGAGSNATDVAIKYAQFAQKAGADSLLVVTPYYNKPQQEGLYQHYKAIHDAVDLPIILYSVPSRTGVELAIETVERLAQFPRIAGIKDATVDLSRPLMMRERITRDDFAFLSGEDATVAAYLAQGGHGCISVTANVAPKECADLHRAWQARDFENFNRLRDWLAPLHRAMFLDTNPVPAKYALSKMGRCDQRVRLPLAPIQPIARAEVERLLKSRGLIA